MNVEVPSLTLTVDHSEAVDLARSLEDAIHVAIERHWKRFSVETFLRSEAPRLAMLEKLTRYTYGSFEEKRERFLRLIDPQPKTPKP